MTDHASNLPPPPLLPSLFLAEELRKVYDPIITSGMSQAFGSTNGPGATDGSGNGRRGGAGAGSASKGSRRSPKAGTDTGTVTVKKELDLVYVTENVVVMAFPYDFQANTHATAAGNDIREVSAYLSKHHAGKFLVWNISEESYDESMFEDQVCVCVSVSVCGMGGGDFAVCAATTHATDRTSLTTPPHPYLPPPRRPPPAGARAPGSTAPPPPPPPSVPHCCRCWSTSFQDTQPHPLACYLKYVRGRIINTV